MKDSFKYLTHNQEDEIWGLYLTVAGNAIVSPGTLYPPKGHPSGYHFNWANGRILHEYQINYITEGEGIVETERGEFQVKEGSVIIIQPGIWHRYKPIRSKGWKEHYIGFNGHMARHIFEEKGFFSDPVVTIGFHENIIQKFNDVLNLTKGERPGYHQICSGLVIQILGFILSVQKNKNISGSKVENAIQKACLIIRENLEKNLNIEELAEELDISYSLFRKAFKNYTGLSPIQYHLSLRIQQAIYLLTNSDLSVKEISFNLGFCSVYYFSKLFKEKTKRTPTEFQRSREK